MPREKTRRQEIVDLLREARWTPDQLRRELELTVRVLEEDLRHVKRSVRAGGRRLQVDPPRCSDCGFQLRSTALHPPGRCPSCRSHRVEGPWLEVR